MVFKLVLVLVILLPLYAVSGMPMNNTTYVYVGLGCWVVAVLIVAYVVGYGHRDDLA
jgi:hypothetical protein